MEFESNVTFLKYSNRIKAIENVVNVRIKDSALSYYDFLSSVAWSCRGIAGYVVGMAG